MARKAWKPESEVPHEIDGTPTVAGLMAMGRDYARMQGNGIHITDKGNALLNAAHKRKALAAIDRGEGNWTRPKSSGREGIARG